MFSRAVWLPVPLRVEMLAPLPYDGAMDDVHPLPAPPGWLEALDRAEADLAACRVVDGRDIHAELAACIERMTRLKAETETDSRHQTR